ncbi:MAG: NAD(P)H-hydrate dehydratase [Pseudomonadota bacterium]|nr:NAD(P)H-hydrate dehydratase [Pseudomonadota bacterium]
MLPISKRVFSAESVRSLDRIAIQEYGIEGYELMLRAGKIAFKILRSEFPDAKHWLIFCGSGNNAGDGYVIAALALKNNIEISVIALSDPNQLSGDAKLAYKDYSKINGTFVLQSTKISDLPKDCDLIIDALLGTGVNRNLKGSYSSAVELINSMNLPIAAVDIPSGLNSNTGQVLGNAVYASLTISFVGLKKGFFLMNGPDHIGELFFDDLSIPSQVYETIHPDLKIFDQADSIQFLTRRSRVTHKSDCGHVLVVGGNVSMGGAVRLAGEAALRSGAGLVSVATKPENISALLTGRPELMCHGITSDNNLQSMLEKADVISIGPGLGQDEWAHSLWSQVKNTNLPLVVDADALNLLAEEPYKRDNWVLTPHPGEAARLLGVRSQDIQADRIAAIKEITSLYGGITLLKGHATLISSSKDFPWMIKAGNPGMSTAGMGDVLTGIISALIAGNLKISSDLEKLSGVVATAAWIHAEISDRKVNVNGERSLIASDLFDGLKEILNP